MYLLPRLHTCALSHPSLATPSSVLSKWLKLAHGNLWWQGSQLLQYQDHQDHRQTQSSKGGDAHRPNCGVSHSWTTSGMKTQTPSSLIICTNMTDWTCSTRWSLPPPHGSTSMPSCFRPLAGSTPQGIWFNQHQTNNQIPTRSGRISGGRDLAQSNSTVQIQFLAPDQCQEYCTLFPRVWRTTKGTQAQSMIGRMLHHKEGTGSITRHSYPTPTRKQKGCFNSCLKTKEDYVLQSRFLQIVMQLMDHSCCHCGSIWKMKHGHWHGAGWYCWGRREKCAGSGSSVTDLQGNGPNEDVLLNVRMDWSDANCFVVVVAVFVSLVACAIFVCVAGWEIEMHTFGPLTG